MPTPNKTGWAGLYEVQERKRAEREQIPEPVRPANPSVTQTPPHSEPVAVTNPTPRPKQTGSQDEPVRHTNGYTQVTNHLLDDILPTLTPQDQAVLVRLYRLTRGHKKQTCKVSRNKLIAKTGVKKTRLLEALTVLEERGYIKRLPDDVESRDVYDRGMNIEMLLEGVDPVRVANPSMERTRSRDEHIKDKALKENLKRELPPAEIKNCPDCQGSGFWYPEGIEKGVAKCKHVRLGREGN
jgi:DNA-binding MarR family transcriptional regulator